MPLLHMCVLDPGAEQPVRCIRLLIEQAACDVHALDRVGSSMLHHAAGTGDLEVFEECHRLMPEFLNRRRPPLRLWRDPHAKLAMLYVTLAYRAGKAKGIFKVLANVPGATPLHIAASFGNYGTTRFLLARGADPTARNCIGNTPLQRCLVQSGRLAGIEALLEQSMLAKGAENAPSEAAAAKARKYQVVPE